MTKTRTSRRPVRGGLVQAEVGIVGMAVVTLLVSLAGLWFSHELKDTTDSVLTATKEIQKSVDGYKAAMKSADTAVLLITAGGIKSDNPKLELAAKIADTAFGKAEVQTTKCINLLETVARLLSTYETTTVTFAGCALIFALFVIIRQFKL